MKNLCMSGPAISSAEWTSGPDTDIGFYRHCDLDEDNDPSSDYEDPLECIICGSFGNSLDSKFICAMILMRVRNV